MMRRGLTIQIGMRIGAMRPCCSVTLIGASAVAAALLAGCGSPKPGGTAPPDFDALAKQKVDVVRKMADAVANDPTGAAGIGAYEEFVNIALEVKDHPNEAKEILEIYNKRIKGKLKGETAVQMQMEMNRYQAELAKVK
jgi:hypothetical protein